MFGAEDNLLMKLASLTNVFTANNMQERYWPVHVIDVGQALELIGYDDNTAGQTYELFGPKNYSTAEIAELVDQEIFKKRRHINLPPVVLKPLMTLLNKVLWWPILSPQDIEKEFIDQVIDENAKTFKDLDIEPGEISKFTYHYLVSSLAPLIARLHSVTDNHTARIPQLRVLRPTTTDREGEEGRAEIPARLG